METIIEKPLIFTNNSGQKLWGVLTLPEGKDKVPGLIMCHGFAKAHTERKFVELARVLAQNNVASLRFDFSGCGNSEGDFEKISIEGQVADLNSAYNILANNEGVDKDKIAIIGHSLGALIAVLLQAEQPRAKTLILLAPAVQQKELISQWYTAGERRVWKKHGCLDTKKGRIGARYLNEAEALDWKKAVSDIKVPVLVIHGTEDEDVPFEYTKELYQQFFCPKRIVHVKAEHHFESHQAKEELIDASLRWLNHLNLMRKRFPKSIRKYIRKEKARIRRDILDIKQQEGQIEEIYKKIIKK